jgi:hypothetical protein
MNAGTKEGFFGSRMSRPVFQASGEGRANSGLPLTFAEIHKFKSSACTILPVRYVTFQNDPASAFSQDPVAATADARWVASRASVPQ